MLIGTPLLDALQREAALRSAQWMATNRTLAYYFDKNQSNPPLLSNQEERGLLTHGHPSCPSLSSLAAVPLPSSPPKGPHIAPPIHYDSPSKSANLHRRSKSVSNRRGDSISSPGGLFGSLFWIWIWSWFSFVLIFFFFFFAPKKSRRISDKKWDSRERENPWAFMVTRKLHSKRSHRFFSFFSTQQEQNRLCFLLLT